MKKQYKKFGNMLTTGQLADAAGIPKSTIQHYLNEKLIHSDEKTDARYLLFDKKKALTRIKKIKHLQDVRRRTIKEINELLNK